MEILKYLILIGCVVFVVFGQSICPEHCECSLDERGRRQVVCTKGGMLDPIPINSIDRDVEVLRISAPPEAPNFLTIGPIFQQFTYLEELHISQSNIPAIGRHSFWGVPTLHVLNLTQNNISHVLDHNFRGLVNLLELHLDENRIESMPSETFRHLHELKVLTLARNRIHELVPRIFLMLGKLCELDLSHNPLGELNPEVFKDIQGLRVFRCRSCHLSNVNTLVYRLLVDLVELDLGNNEFKYILSDEFHFLRKLQILRLEGNQLAVVLDNTFDIVRGSIHKYAQGQTDLQVINLSRNRLVRITAHAFGNLTTLRVMDISYNKFDKLEPATFLPLVDSLRTLNLSGNVLPMEELKFIIQILPKLRHLSLAEMKLRDLPLGLFAYHDHLKFLNLSGNHFSQLSHHLLTSVTRIHTLDLSRNRFRGFNEKILTRLEKIPNLLLRSNPWACDLCYIPSILNRVNKTFMNHALKDLTCKSPYSLAGRTISSLQGHELQWCTSIEYSADEENTGAVGIPQTSTPDVAHVNLILGLGALVIIVFFGIGAVMCVAYSRYRTNQYYTREEEIKQSESVFGSAQVLSNESVDKAYKSLEVPKMNKKKVSIATIDEIVKYPELHALANGT